MVVRDKGGGGERMRRGEGWKKGGRIEGRVGVVMRKRTLFPSLSELDNYYTGVTLNSYSD